MASSDRKGTQKLTQGILDAVTLVPVTGTRRGPKFRL